MSRIKRLFLSVLLVFIFHTANAQQLHFSKVEKGDSYQFNYQWLDHQQQAQSIAFSITKSSLFNKFRNFKEYKPELASKYISRKVVRYLNKNPIDGVRISYNSQTGSIVAKGTDSASLQTAEKKVAELNKEFTDAYMKKHWYHTFTTYQQLQAIKPDHATFAALSAEDMKPLKPLILEKVSVKNIRQATDYVLAFVQSIPYSPLESRVDSSGAGFNPPLKLLWENQGDCDSKVTLAAAILRTLMPRIKMVLVFIDNHALIGIDAQAQGNETTITIDGTTYLLGEPTGPAPLVLGQLDQASELAIAQGQYSAEVFQ
ncbi:hypothetical protein ACPUVO_06800 [Pseudocolwellia sp. HL-MZ19]|uniref:hypothetical protein n=1 Tax=unclassified Pseudocolwellia TaxID=2848178 RepID=UPI003CF66533